MDLRVDLELNKVVHQALADEGVRKAVKSAEAEGYSAASLKVGATFRCGFTIIPRCK